MIRTCNSGGAYNIFRDIDRDFAVHYFIHGSKSCNFASLFFQSVVSFTLTLSVKDIILESKLNFSQYHTRLLQNVSGM